MLRELYRSLVAIRASSPTASSISRIESDVRDLGPEIEDFLRQTPEDPWLRRAWGLFLLSHGRPGEALAHLEVAATTFEDDPMGRFALAECRMALGVLEAGSLHPRHRSRAEASTRRGGGSCAARWRRPGGETMTRSRACGGPYRPIPETRRPITASAGR